MAIANASARRGWLPTPPMRRSPDGRDRRGSSGARGDLSGAPGCRGAAISSVLPSSASSSSSPNSSRTISFARSRSICMAISLPMTRCGPCRRTRASVRATAVAARRSSTRAILNQALDGRLDGDRRCSPFQRGASAPALPTARARSASGARESMRLSTSRGPRVGAVSSPQ